MDVRDSVFSDIGASTWAERYRTEQFYHTSVYIYVRNIYVVIILIFCNSIGLTGYIRVSTEKQKEDASHEKQRSRLEEWDDTRDYDITLYEDIAISGQAAEREAYARTQSHELLRRVMLDEITGYDGYLE